MKNLINKGFKYFVAVMMVFSLMSMEAWANGSENSIPSETGSTTTENKETTKDTGDSQGDTADQLISNEEKKTNTSQESADKEGQTDQTIDKKTDYTYEDKKISVKAVLANASAISDQAELKVKEIPESTTEYEKYEEALNKKSNLYSNVLLYDISFILNGKEVEPTDGNVKVSMSFKDQQLSDDLKLKSANDLKVIHFKDNDVNKQESLKPTTNVKNETTSFETKSFSTVAITDGPYNLADKGWIKSVTVDKQENGEWKANPSGEFKNGDAARVSISYKIPENQIQGKGSAVTYKIPNGVTVTKEQSGPILEDPNDPNSIVYGTYTVSTDGTINIIFNENYDPNILYTGHVQFEGKIDKSKAGDSGKVSFPGSSTSITIENGGNQEQPDNNKTDIKMEKSGVLSEDRDSIEYTVIASTTNGTAGPVDIKDEISWLQNVNASYVQSSLTVVKEERNGYSYPINTNANFGNNIYNQNMPYFELKQLPQLSVGEKYLIKYKVKLTHKYNSNGDIYVNNSVQGNSGNDNGNASSSQHMEKMIEKNGWQSGDEITWRIDLNNDHRNLKKYNYILYDQLPQGLTIKRNIRVYYEEHNSMIEVPEMEKTNFQGQNYFSIDFSKLDDSLKNKKFVIDYTTNAPEVPKNEKSVSVTNSGKIYSNDEGEGHTYEASKTIEISKKDISIKKEASKDGGDNPVFVGEKAKYTWKVNMGLTGKSITGFTYKDVIENAKNKSDSKDLGGSSHYAIAKDIKDLFNTKDVLKLTGIDSNNQSRIYVPGKEYKWSLICYDENNHVIANDNTTDHVKSFEIRVEPIKGFELKPTNFEFKYTTYGNHSGIKEGETFVFPNTGEIVEHNGEKIEDKKCTTETEYKYSKKIEKLASENGNKNTYSHDDLNISLDKTKGIINYRILFTIDKSQTGSFTVTDELPKGMSLNKDSVKFRFYQDEDNNWDSNYNQSYRYSIGLENRHYSFNVDKPIINETTTKDGKTLISFTFLDGYEFDNKDSWQIAIDYQGVVSNDSDWNDMTKTEKSYTNTATWGDSSSSQTTKVTRTVEKVSKNVQRLKGASGSDTNTLEYYVDINPSGSDLIPGSDTLTLRDTLKVNGGVQAYLDLDNVHLYKYDHLKDKHMGSELDKSLYSLTYNSETHKMEVELPDSQACVFVYRYTINTGNLASGSTNIYNEANLNGEYSSNKSIDFNINSSSASLSGKKVTLEKVDADNNTVFLKGAKFSIEKRENGNWVTQSASDVTSSNDLITDDDGKISFTHLDDDILYRIKETKAPEGYRLPTNKYYYLIQTNGTIKDSAKNDLYSKLDDDAKKEIGNIKNVLFFGTGAGKFYVPNTPSGLTVNKKWVNKDNTPSTPGENSVSMTLKRYIKSGDKLTETNWSESFELSASNGWSKHWDNLPSDDGKGNNYVYKVVEDPVDGYEVTYRGDGVNHGGIDHGAISVINKGEKKTILPSTGGTGTKKYYLLGTLLSMLGVIYIVMKLGKGGLFGKEDHS